MVFDVIGTLVDEIGSVRADVATDQGEWACASLLVPARSPIPAKVIPQLTAAETRIAAMHGEPASVHRRGGYHPGEGAGVQGHPDANQSTSMRSHRRFLHLS
jgi:hypothetical protein